ncbi:hypothetical protein [Pandoraea pnomenusa]|uniref:hypothetical protein n=1 Tax=Pandoraea pnomenusa TaxID=93220 RepID=UPI001AC134AF|nr:hypothetical protein [Pandoraea pnomenusa]MBN9091820.1 hypothetical protein [Pandoraea pnomenusa]
MAKLDFTDVVMMLWANVYWVVQSQASESVQEKALAYARQQHYLAYPQYTAAFQ